MGFSCFLSLAAVYYKRMKGREKADRIGVAGERRDVLEARKTTARQSGRGSRRRESRLRVLLVQGEGKGWVWEEKTKGPPAKVFFFSCLPWGCSKLGTVKKHQGGGSVDGAKGDGRTEREFSVQKRERQDDEVKTEGNRLSRCELVPAPR